VRNRNTPPVKEETFNFQQTPLNKPTKGRVFDTEKIKIDFGRSITFNIKSVSADDIFGFIKN